MINSRAADFFGCERGPGRVDVKKTGSELGGNDDRGLETIRSCNRKRERLRWTAGRRRNRLSEPRTCVAWGYPARERICGSRLGPLVRLWARSTCITYHIKRQHHLYTARHGMSEMATSPAIRTTYAAQWPVSIFADNPASNDVNSAL